MTEVLRFSELLSRVVHEHPADRIGPADLVATIGDRTLGALLLLFALPNLLPLIPGMSLVTAIPLILISAQMTAGKHQPWLPKWIMRASIAKAQAVKGLPRVLKFMRYVERLIRPRLEAVTGHSGTRLIGVMALFLSLLAWLPIPGLHYIPALVIALFGLALINRDGLLAIVAWLGGAAGIVLLSGIVIAGTEGLVYLGERYLGV